MKIVIVCLILMLTCSCCRDTVNTDPAKRRDEIRNILKNYHRTRGSLFEIRGPFTFEQVAEDFFESKKKILKEMEKVRGVTYTVEDYKTGKFLEPFRLLYKEGDEFYFFTTDKSRWERLLGAEGYVLIRKNKVIHMIITGVS